MSELITGIRLSSGTTINIPIFPYNTERAVIEKMGGVVKVRRYDRSASSPSWVDIAGLSDNDLFELASLINSKRINQYYNDNNVNPPNVPMGTTDIWAISYLYYRENANGEYELITNIHTNTPASTTLYITKLCTYGVNDPDDGSWETNHVAYQGINRRFGTYDTMVASMATSTSTTDYCFNLTDNSITGDYLNIMTTIGSGTSTGIDWAERYEAYQEIEPDNNISLIETDPDNPYTYEASTFGGGNGRWGTFDPDSIEFTEIPDLPTISAANAGFISIYNPTVSQLRALSAFLWSPSFDIDTFKKLFQDPMEAIIGLSVVPVRPPLSGSRNVMFGDVDTGVAMTAVASEYVEKDCGSVNLELLYGSFMDYDYTKIQIYLPYIGFRDLNPKDIIGDSINVTYHINVLDGGITAYISSSRKGVLYQFSGSCIANIPLTAINYSGAIQNAVSALGAASIAGVSGSPIMAMSAINNVASLAANTNSSIQRSGNVSGSAGLMGIQRPFIIIERPNISVPASYPNHNGNTTNVTMRIGSCTGFTVIDQVHLDNVTCTDNERDELLRLLKEGVIL